MSSFEFMSTCYLPTRVRRWTCGSVSHSLCPACRRLCLLPGREWGGVAVRSDPGVRHHQTEAQRVVRSDRSLGRFPWRFEASEGVPPGRLHHKPVGGYGQDTEGRDGCVVQLQKGKKTWNKIALKKYSLCCSCVFSRHNEHCACIFSRICGLKFITVLAQSNGVKCRLCEMSLCIF